MHAAGYRLHITPVGLIDRRNREPVKYHKPGTGGENEKNQRVSSDFCD
jgi:hypothetical protein